MTGRLRAGAGVGGYRRPVTSLWLLDGLRRVDPGLPVLRADDLGFLHGESAFETVRVANGRPTLLDAHLARLAASAARLDLDVPDGFDRLALAAADGQGDAVLRLVCSKGPPPVGFALVNDIPAATLAARRDGVRAVTLALGIAADQRSAAPWLLGGVKTTSYAVSTASLRHARSVGADDAVWVSSDGEVLEGATSAVAIVQDGALVTPPTSVGILASTTLQAVLDLDLVRATVRRLPVRELHAADEVMLLSSIRGVTPVIELDGRQRPVGAVTRTLSDALEASLQG
jgi:4-amino-4-deoxychorismate lyase